MELPWSEAQSAVRPFERRIEEVAVEALSTLVRELKARGMRVCGVGVIGSTDRNLERIGNPHIRAHAAEGVLFRKVLEVAARKQRLGRLTFSDRGLEELASSELELPLTQVKSVLAGIGRAAGRPWRADERAAATAAWLVLRARA